MREDGAPALQGNTSRESVFGRRSRKHLNRSSRHLSQIARCTPQQRLAYLQR